MTAEDTFTGARNGLAFLFAYQNTVAQDMGRERAMALNRKMTEAMGTVQGKELRDQVDIEEAPPKLAASLAGEFLAHALGIRSEITESSAEKAVIEVGRCPIYEAAQALGMEHQAIKGLCRAGSMPYMNAIVKQFNPDLRYELSRFRPSADTPCVEMIAAEEQ